MVNQQQVMPIDYHGDQLCILRIEMVNQEMNPVHEYLTTSSAGGLRQLLRNTADTIIIMPLSIFTVILGCAL